MFSIQKLLVLAAIIAAIWYGFKLVGRLDRARKRKLREEAAQGKSAGSAKAENARAPDDVIDLVQTKDGAYEARDRTNRRT